MEHYYPTTYEEIAEQVRLKAARERREKQKQRERIANMANYPDDFNEKALERNKEAIDAYKKAQAKKQLKSTS